MASIVNRKTLKWLLLVTAAAISLSLALWRLSRAHNVVLGSLLRVQVIASIGMIVCGAIELYKTRRTGGGEGS